MQIGEATPGAGSQKCPTYPQSCVSGRFLPPPGSWGFFSNVTAGKNPFHRVTSIPPCRQWGSASSDADGRVVLLHFPCLPGGVTQDPPGQEKALLSFSFQQEKCHSDVGGGRVGGSPWLVRKHCFYVISLHTPGMCGK